jgi:hypothetical protein
MADISIEDAARALRKGQEIYDRAYLAHVQGEMDEESWRQAQILWQRQQRAFEKVTGQRLARSEEVHGAESAYIFLVQLLTSLLMLFGVIVWPLATGLGALWGSWDTALVIFYAMIPMLTLTCALLSSTLVRVIPPAPLRLRLSLPAALLASAANMALVLLFALGVIPAIQTADPVALSIYGVIAVSGLVGVTRLFQTLVSSE